VIPHEFSCDLDAAMNNRAPAFSGSQVTHWSLVVAAGQPGAAGAQALETLCQQYWPAVYAYVRRRTKSVDDAQDLTQEFFRQFLERRAVACADPCRGKFRAFLFTAVRNFLIDQAERLLAIRRGGGVRAISLDFGLYDSRTCAEPMDLETPEAVFDRHWAQSLLAQTVSRLRAEFAAAGRPRDFELLLPYLSGPPPGEGHEPLARSLNVSEPAARQAASRFRKRYREILRREIAETLTEPTEGNIDAELRELFTAVAAAR